MSVYAINDVTLAALKKRLPAADNEPVHVYLARVEAAGLARVLERAAASDPQTYREAAADADKRRIPLLVRDPMPPPVDPSRVIRLSRTEAKDPYRYRAARDRAEAMGAQLVFVDE